MWISSFTRLYLFLPFIHWWSRFVAITCASMTSLNVNIACIKVNNMCVVKSTKRSVWYVAQSTRHIKVEWSDWLLLVQYQNFKINLKSNQRVHFYGCPFHFCRLSNVEIKFTRWFARSYPWVLVIGVLIVILEF